MGAPLLFEHTEPDNTILRVRAPEAINAVLQVTARHHRPITDDLLVQVFHRTTGSGRSALLDRAAVTELHAALGRWLETGWPGVPKT